MPKASAHDIISRQWQLLRRLPRRRPGVTAAELQSHLETEGFSVTKRTIERDLLELERHFQLDCDNRSKPHHWRWRDGAVTELGGLDISDALSLALAEQAIRPLLPASLLRALEPRFALARSKLAGLEKHSFARWLDKVRSVPAALNFQAPRIPDAVLRTVHEALLEETCLEIAYANPGDRKAKTLPLHPLGLVQRGPVAYLVTSAHDYDDPRLYALHRMSRARRLDTPRRVPPGFTLDACLAAGHLDFAPGEPIILTRNPKWIAAIWRNLLVICSFVHPLNALFSAPRDSRTTI